MPSLTFDLDAANESDDSNKKSGVQNYALSLLSDLMIVEEFKALSTREMEIVCSLCGRFFSSTMPTKVSI